MRRVVKEAGNKISPYRDWPVWKTIGLALLAYGGMGAVLTFSSSVTPVFFPRIVGPVSAAISLLGVALTLWSRSTHGWVPRTGAGALYSVLLFGLAWRSWFAVLNDLWLWVIVLAVAMLVALAWALPAISDSLSATLWREQTYPQTQAGRTIMKWILGIGLGGAGIAGATLGTSLSRTGEVHFGYLIVALGTTAVAVLQAQGYSHQVWPDRPWADQTGSKQIVRQP
ncbi:MAG TPA: hypothetical protein VJK02_03520 [Anaerolineales bacterium]|nr:hypothetical protein [Anaerolineales bacterium]